MTRNLARTLDEDDPEPFGVFFASDMMWRCRNAS